MPTVEGSEGTAMCTRSQHDMALRRKSDPLCFKAGPHMPVLQPVACMMELFTWKAELVPGSWLVKFSKTSLFWSAKM